MTHGSEFKLTAVWGQRWIGDESGGTAYANASLTLKTWEDVINNIRPAIKRLSDQMLLHGDQLAKLELNGPEMPF